MNLSLKKRFFPAVLAFLLCFLSVPSFSLDCERVCVIVRADNKNDVCAVRRAALSSLPGAKAGHLYEALFSGFGLEVCTSDLEALKALPGVADVYADTVYSPCSSSLQYNLIFDSAIAGDYDKSYGRGGVVAVIDDCFDVRHEAFFLEEDGTLALSSVSIAQKIHFTNASKLYPYKKIASAVYKSAKIPFAFDYSDADCNVAGSSDHGTAMASAAAASPEKSALGIYGAAPGAQLLLMKVFSDNSTSARSSDIIAAMEDAYLLGADSVCLSLGSPCGFSEYGLYDTALESAIEKLTSLGVCVVCPAGNTSSLGSGSVYDTYYGYYEAPASLPDSGTVSAPGTAPDALSVASADTFTAKYPAFSLSGTDIYIPFSDVNRTVVQGVKTKDYFYVEFDGMSLEYELIGGIGTDSDYARFSDAQASLAGKAVLVERGEITFAEKVNTAAKYGAAAVIIYDNEENPLSLKTRMDLTGTEIPAVFISKSDGEIMKKAKKREISVNRYDKYVTSLSSEPDISELSSSGPTPTLAIKPELASPGENVAVAVRGSSYGVMSGTSVSAAYTAGIIAGASRGFDSYNGAEKVRRIKNSLMSSAIPIKNTEGYYYSVNKQGAGLISPSEIRDSQLILSCGTSSAIMLGNNLEEKFAVSLNIENTSDRELKLKLSALVGTEKTDKVDFASLCSEKDAFYKASGKYLYDYLNLSGGPGGGSVYFTDGTILPLDGASVKYNETELCANQAGQCGGGSASLTVKPHSAADVTLDFDLSDIDFATLEKIFENGFFIEGYIFVQTESAAPDEKSVYSVPFLGFYGDFYSVNPFAESLYKNGAVFGGNYLYTFVGTKIQSGDIYIGTNSAVENSIFTRLYEELAYISPYAEGSDGIIYLSLNPLRNLKTLSACIYSPSGEQVAAAESRKSVAKAVSSTDFNSGGGYSLRLWDLRSAENDRYIYPDGVYTCVLTGTDAADNLFSDEIKFTIDSEKPKLANYSIIRAGGKETLKITAQDNGYVSYASLTDENGSTADFDLSALSDEKLLKMQKGGEVSLEADISSLSGKYLYVTVYDIAYNKTVFRIER